MQINVIGVGYVGLPTAIMLAESGYSVTGTDTNLDYLNKLTMGDFIMADEVLDLLLKKNLGGTLSFSSDVISADLYFIAVQTPYNKTTRKIDDSFIIQSINSILNVKRTEYLIVIESTVSPGTIHNLRKIYSANSKKVIFVHAPERILPGNTYYELVNNSRIIGSDIPEASDLVSNLFKSFVKGEIIQTDIITAELAKVVENTYRDVNIALANEIALICNELDVNPFELIRIANKHPRVNILKPGPGVGGHCIPVDPWFLVGDYPAQTKLVRTAREVNDSMPNYIVDRIIEIADYSNIKYDRIGLYGMTYKPNVKDYRESPSFKIIEIFKSKKGLSLNSFDPYDSDKDYLEIDFEEFVKNNFFIVILVDHKHILENLSAIEDKIIFDTKNITHLTKAIKL